MQIDHLKVPGERKEGFVILLLGTLWVAHEFDQPPG